MAGELNSDELVIIHQLRLPKMQPNITLNELHARVFKAACGYDIILGRDALQHFQLVLDFSKNVIHSNNRSIPMHIFPSTFTGLQNLTQKSQLNSVDAFTNPNSSRDTVAITHGNKPRI